MPVRYPMTVPPAAEIIDSAAAVENLKGLRQRFPDARGDIVFTVSYDTAGVPAWFRVLANDVETVPADSIADVLRPHLRERRRPPDEPSLLHFQLAVELRDSIRIHTRPSDYVAPKLLNQRGVETMLTDAGRAGKRGDVVLRIQVREDGSVGDIRVVSNAADPSLDDAAIRIARIMDFSPGTFDGVPVTVWVFMPIRIRERGG